VKRAQLVTSLCYVSWQLTDEVQVGMSDKELRISTAKDRHAHRPRQQVVRETHQIPEHRGVEQINRRMIDRYECDPSIDTNTQRFIFVH